MNSSSIKPIPTLPFQLKEAAEHGDLVIFVGAGCSCLLGYPNWNQYADKMLQKVFNSAVCDQLCRLDAKTKISIAVSAGINLPYEDILRPSNETKFERNRKRLNDALLKLSKLYITTNYDDELDNMFLNREVVFNDVKINNNIKKRKVCPESKIVYKPNECSYADLSCKNGVVLHIHGSFKKPDYMVQTVEDYLNLYHKPINNIQSDTNISNVIYLLENLFKFNHKVLFIGYGCEEMEILEYMLQKGVLSENKHKFFMLRGFFSHQENIIQKLKDFYEKQLKIELIPYLMDEKHHEQLLDVLEVFANEIVPCRDELVDLPNILSVFQNVNDGMKAETIAQMLAENKDHAIQNEVYKKILQEQNPEIFFDEFNNKGLFGKDFIPEVVITEKDGHRYYSSRHWPASEYLIHMASDLTRSKKIKKVIHSVSNNYNYDKEKYSYIHIFWAFAEMFARMPVDSLTYKDITLIDIWLKTDGNQNSLAMGTIFQQIIPKFLKSKNYRNLDKACKILDICTQLRNMKEDKIYSVRNVLYPYQELFGFNKHILNVARLFGERTGEKAALIFLKRLLEACGDDKEGILGISWRPAVEDHQQNENRDNVFSILVAGLRDCINGYVSTDPVAASIFLKDMLLHEYAIIRRVAISVIDENWNVLSCLCKDVIDSDLFAYYLRHETYIFLKHHFVSFSEENQSKLLEKLDHLKKDGDEKYLKYDQFIYLSCMVEKGNKRADGWYEKLAAAGLKLKDHPDFLTYLSCDWLKGTERSPYDSNDILSFVISGTLITILNDFVPIDDGTWNNPNVEDFAKMLEETIVSYPIIFAPIIMDFENTKIPYQHALVKAYKDLWSKNSSGDLNWDEIWEQLFSLMGYIVNDEKIWDMDKGKDGSESYRYPNKESMLNVIVDLLKAGVNDEHSHSEAMVPHGFDLLKKYIVNMDRLVPKSYDDIHDIVNVAINRLEGRVIETLIEYLLHECRLSDKINGNHDNIFDKYQGLFESEFSLYYSSNYIFFCLFILYIRQMLYVNYEWTEKKVENIFSASDDMHFLCALGGLNYIPFSKVLYEMLEKVNTWDRFLSIKIINNDLQKRMYAWLAMGYLTGLEELDGKHFNILYEQFKIEALSVAAEEYYRLRNDIGTNEFKDKIVYFWSKTGKWIMDNRDNMPKDVGKLCMKLSFLICYLDRIEGKDNEELFKFLVTWQYDDYFDLILIFGKISELYNIPENREAIINALLILSERNPTIYDYDNKIHGLIEKIGKTDDQKRTIARTIASNLKYPDLYNSFS